MTWGTDPEADRAAFGLISPQPHTVLCEGNGTALQSELCPTHDRAGAMAADYVEYKNRGSGGMGQYWNHANTKSGVHAHPYWGGWRDPHTQDVVSAPPGGLPEVPADPGAQAQDEARANQSALSGRAGRLSLAQGQVMTLDILCPEMTPSFREE